MENVNTVMTQVVVHLLSAKGQDWLVKSTKIANILVSFLFDFKHINLFLERANSFSKRNLDTGSIHIERNFFFGPSELVFQIFLESNFSTIDPLKSFRHLKVQIRELCVDKLF